MKLINCTIYDMVLIFTIHTYLKYYWNGVQSHKGDNSYKTSYTNQ